MQQSSIENFALLTGYDLSTLLVILDSFFSSYQPQLVAFCNGQTTETPTTALKLLTKLKAEVGTVLELYHLRQSNFKTIADWEILEVMDEFRTRLATTQNLPKYLRSAKVGAGYVTTPTTTAILMPGQTLENFLRKRSASTTTENDWATVALQQDISEERYGPDTDPLAVQIPGQANSGQSIESVLGYAVGEEGLGRDLQAKLEFIDHDLAVLSPSATVYQSFGILLNLQQEDIPEYPAFGLTPIVGMSKGSISFRMPTIMRQLTQTFATDDTFLGVRVEQIDLNSADAISLRIGATAVAKILEPQALIFQQ